MTTPAMTGKDRAMHTPGPWTYLEVIGGCFVNAGARQVLRYASSPDAENKANARLIAAAPDMLETLEWLESIGGLGVSVHERIRAAIAKATGATL